jgi:hypothetical protein
VGRGLKRPGPACLARLSVDVSQIARRLLFDQDAAPAQPPHQVADDPVEAAPRLERFFGARRPFAEDRPAISASVDAIEHEVPLHQVVAAPTC